MKKMSNFLDNIKLIASELANMSPKTQLEIVKLCKNLCLNVKDYLVELDETTLANILSRLDNLEDEMETAEGNIQANANAIDTINDTIDLINTALNNRYTKQEVNQLLLNKINIVNIVLTGDEGTLTPTQLNDVLNNQNIIIERDNLYYYKNTESENFIEFTWIKNTNLIQSDSDTAVLTGDTISINKTSGAWTRVYGTGVIYYKDKVDELIAGAGGGLEKIWENPSPGTNFNPQTITIENLSNYNFLVMDITVVRGVLPSYRETNLIDLSYPNNIIRIVGTGSISYRTLTINKANGTIQFSAATHRDYTTIGTSDTGDQHCVPMTIYGIK